MVPKHGERVGMPVLNMQKYMQWLFECAEFNGSNTRMFAKTVDVRACAAISMAAKH
jgi:hypothetical protein